MNIWIMQLLIILKLIDTEMIEAYTHMGSFLYCARTIYNYTESAADHNNYWMLLNLLQWYILLPELPHYLP